MITDRGQDCQDRLLCTQIIGEYLEMPGLSLTILQGCRLWGIDRPRCAHVLDTLIVSGFLRKGGESYVRADAGRYAAVVREPPARKVPIDGPAEGRAKTAA